MPGECASWLFVSLCSIQSRACFAVADAPKVFRDWDMYPAWPANDTDSDGIPDTWEVAHGLNPLNASDANLIFNHTYSYLELYLHWRAKQLVALAPEVYDKRVIHPVWWNMTAQNIWLLTSPMIGTDISTVFHNATLTVTSGQFCPWAPVVLRSMVGSAASANWLGPLFNVRAAQTHPTTTFLLMPDNDAQMAATAPG